MAMARMELLVLVVLFSLEDVHSYIVSKGHPGLSCVNDLVNNVSCSWRGSPVGPDAVCWICGVKLSRNKERLSVEKIRCCQLKLHRNSFPGCSFVFEKEEFNCFRAMPYIHMKCDGELMDNLTSYDQCSHVKMHPPGMPNVSRSPNETQISWSLGRPTAIFLKVLDFEVEIKQKHQKWEEALTLSTQKQEVRIRRGKLKRHCQARVRVKPNELYTSHWSDWSSTTSWQEAEDVEEPSQNQEEFRTLIVTWGVVGSLVLILVVMLVLCRSCLSRGLYKKKPVPNPSRYFHSLYSVHEGNLKKWMNPLTASESFFMAHPADQISPVELCGSPDVDPSTSPSVATSTSALLSFKGHPSAGTNTSGVLDKSSSTSSSSFSNMGYFMSSSSGGSAPSNPGRAYFTYQGDIRTPNNSRVLCLSLCPTFNTSPAYESLKGEPQSPDSGFGVGKEDEEKVVGVKEEKDSDHSPALIILPLHLPSQLFPPSSSPPPSPNAPILTPVSTDSFQVDEPVEAGAGSYAAWPLAGAVCRSSSMPVESGKTGYLTLKELQTSFSNKSI